MTHGLLNVAVADQELIHFSKLHLVRPAEALETSGVLSVIDPKCKTIINNSTVVQKNVFAN